MGGAAVVRGRAARLVSGVRWCGRDGDEKNWWVANVAVVVARPARPVLVSRS